jgi:hypothetical protein
VLDVLAEYDREVQTSEGAAVYSMQVVLHEEKRLDDLLSAMVELGITNAVVLDGESMAPRWPTRCPVCRVIFYVARYRARAPRWWCARCAAGTRANACSTCCASTYRFQRPNQGYIRLIRVDELLGNPEEAIDHLMLVYILRHGHSDTLQRGFGSG